MCVSPLVIKNPSKTLANGQQWKLVVPCGKCYQCQQRLSIVYQMRSYFEAMDCINKGGFVYMDCLTYSDEFLPRLSKFTTKFSLCEDFPCFSYPDIRFFMVRLRKMLSDAGYDVADKLRYFISSEYGTTLGCTHRPHYHVLFYCNVPYLTSLVLSMYISKAWYFGITDGLPRKNKYYVYKNTFDASSDRLALNKCISYVTKYLEKQGSYLQLLSSRFEQIVYNYDLEKGSSRYREYKKEFYKYSSPFHRQSLHFGVSALNYPRNSYEKIMETGCMYFPDKKGKICSIPLPQYFVRKYFYNLTRCVDGSISWQINARGVAFKMKNLDQCIERYSLRCKDLVFNHFSNEQMDFLNKVLNGRSLYDYSKYVLCFKGRLAFDAIPIDYRESYYVNLVPLKYNVVYNYITQKDKDTYGCKFQSLKDVENSFVVFDDITFTTGSFLRCAKKVMVRGDTSSLLSKIPYCYDSEFLSRYIINDQSLKEFNGFDTVFNLFADVVYSSHEACQEAYKHLQDLRQLYKSIFKT